MDVKGALYAALGRRKIGTPSYEVQVENRGGRQRFRCELRVPNINYVGMGNSTNKKDAQTNAARDFGAFMIREGMLDACDLPPLGEADLEATSVPFGGAADNSSFGYEEKPSIFAGGGIMDVGVQNVSNSHRPYSLTKQDRYVEQKFEEVLQSESVDLTANIHGGWTMENCRQALNEYLQKNRQPAADFHINSTGNDHSKNFVGKCSVFIPALGRTINGNGQGSSKKVAQGSCCLSIVRQLFHMGVLGLAGEKIGLKKTTASELPPIKVRVAESLSIRVNNYLRKVGIQPITDVDVSSGVSKSLVVDQKLDEFPTSVSNPAGIIAWSPSMQNWNPWRATNIDEKPLAFMSMEEISKDLMMREKAKEIPASMKRIRETLPVHRYRQQILDLVANNSVVLIKGSTGCGKSTQICQYLLEQHVLDNRGAHFNCFVSQPRRISAITLAERVAAERCEELGDSMGFSVRFEGCTPRPYGAVMFVTVGVLMRKMEYGVRGISHIIIDEIHERDINTDFLLIVIRELVKNNPKLRIILMSATIDTSLFIGYFGECCSVPVIEIEQRIHPVQHFFLENIIQMLGYMPPLPEPKKNKKKRKDQLTTGNEDDEINEETSTVTLEEKNLLITADEDEYGPEVKQALTRMNERDIPLEVIEVLLTDIVQKGQAGAVLIFLPGWNIISMLQSNLQRHPIFGNPSKFLILPLHSQLTGREQHRVFEPVGPNMRKIILSTNIAETSVTIDDVVYVIDSCRAREKMYSSRNNMVHFATVWASRNNLIQRRGRAGRVQEGFCFHLCTGARYSALEENRLAEMLRTPLEEIALTIKLLRLGSVGAFLDKAVEPPPCDAIIEAEVLLRGTLLGIGICSFTCNNRLEMSALDKNLELTPLGRILARLPIDPKTGKTIILGIGLGIGEIMCTLAAATSFNTPFVPRERFYTKLGHCHRAFSGNRLSDHVGLVAVNNRYAEEFEYGPQSAETFCTRNSLSATILNMSFEAKRQLCEVLVNNSGFPQCSLSKYNIDTFNKDLTIDLFLSLLVYAYYPNICHLDGKGKRKVYTLEQATALLSKLSVCVPFNPTEILPFTSSLCVFTEKLRTSVISCKQISMISPLQLLVFGSRKIEMINENAVCLDEMITLEMDAKIAAQIVALRPCLEALIVRICMHPETMEIRTDDDLELIEILKQISSDTDWISGNDDETLNEHRPLMHSQASRPGYHRVNQHSFDSNGSNYNQNLLYNTLSSSTSNECAIPAVTSENPIDVMHPIMPAAERQYQNATAYSPEINGYDYYRRGHGISYHRGNKRSWDGRGDGYSNTGGTPYSDDGGPLMKRSTPYGNNRGGGGTGYFGRGGGRGFGGNRGGNRGYGGRGW